MQHNPIESVRKSVEGEKKVTPKQWQQVIDELERQILALGLRVIELEAQSKKGWIGR